MFQICSLADAMPLHIILHDVIRKPADVERLREAGLLLNAACHFCTESKESDQNRDEEFLYGAPLSPMPIPEAEADEEEDVEEEDEGDEVDAAPEQDDLAAAGVPEIGVFFMFCCNHIVPVNFICVVLVYLSTRYSRKCPSRIRPQLVPWGVVESVEGG